MKDDLLDAAGQRQRPRGDDDDDLRPRRRVRWGRLLLALCVVGAPILYAARRPLLVRIPPLLVARDAPRAADALVVLSGDHEGARVVHAAKLWKEGLVATGPFVTSGGQLYDELVWARVMSAHAQRLGVPASRIITQDQGTTTQEEAKLTIDLLRARGVKTLLLVTSPYHSGRAARLFRAEAEPAGIEVVSCPSADDPPEEWWTDPVATRYLVSELLKRIY